MNMTEEVLTISNRGLITIPSEIRKKYHLQPGTKLLLIEEEGQLALIPLMDLETLAKHGPTCKQLLESFEEEEKQESELEK